MSRVTQFNDMGHLHLKWFPDGHPSLSKSARARTPRDAEVGYAARKAACKQCQADIAPGSPRATLFLQCHRGYKNKAHLHVGCLWDYDEALRLHSVDELAGLEKLKPADQKAVRDGFAALSGTARERRGDVDAEVLAPPADPRVPTPGSCLESIVRAVVALSTSGAAATEAAILKWLANHGRSHSDRVLARGFTGGLRRAVLTRSKSGAYTASRLAAAAVGAVDGVDAKSSPPVNVKTESQMSPGKHHASGVSSSCTAGARRGIAALVVQAVGSLKATGGASAAAIEAWVDANAGAEAGHVSRRALRAAIRTATREGAIVQHHAKVPTFHLKA